jgi:hypothetical protein
LYILATLINALSFAAGAMIFVVVEETPESYRLGDKHSNSLSAIWIYSYYYLHRTLWGCEFMFYDSYDHFALALNAKSKIVRIDSGNKNYLLPYGTVGFPRIQSYSNLRILYIHIYSSFCDLN